jgi:NAD+ synthase
MSIDETEKTTQIDKEKIEKINQLHINSEHKRLPSQKPDRD